MQRRFIYLINPAAGSRGKGLLRQQIEAAATTAGFEFHLYSSVPNGDYSFLFPFIRQNAITDIVIAGGDGTINDALNSLRHEAVQFGILPCGSGNGLAFSAGIPARIDKALQVIFRGRSEWADAFLINGRFACMLCGLGFDAQVAHDFANDPNRGLRTYIKKSVQHFFRARAYPFILRLNETEVAVEAFFISIANSNQFGNHFTIAPRASLTDGLLDIVIMTRQNKFNLLLHTLRQVSGFNRLQAAAPINKHTGVIYLQTDALEINNPSLAPLHLDGDPAETADRIQIAMLKRCYRLIFP